MSAPPEVLSTRVPDAPHERRDVWLAATLGTFAFAFLAALAFRIAEHGFQARVTLELTNTLVGAGEGVQLDFLDSLGRVATIVTLLVVEAIPGLSVALLPAVTVVAAALFVGALVWRLDRQGWPGTQILVVVAALLAHPLFLRAATSGTTVLLSALAFFLLVYAIERLEHVGDVQAQMNVGLALGALVLVNPQAIYVILPLMALLPLLYHEIRDATSGIAALLMVVMPPLIGLATFIYLHMAFSQEPLSRPFDLWASPLHGSVTGIEDYDWLIRYGGDLLAPLGLLLLATLVCVPGHIVVVWRLLAARAERNRPGTALAALLIPAIAGALATDQMHTRSAWPYLLAGLMAFLVWLSTKPLPDYVRRRALVLLVAGTLAAWMYPPLWAERGAGAWRAAFISDIAPPADWPSNKHSWFARRHITEPLRGYAP